jgi:hypothetical protein
MGWPSMILYSARKVLNLSNIVQAGGCCEAASMLYRSMLAAISL